MYLDKALQFASIGLLVYLPINAYAYLDPGTGSMLLSCIDRIDFERLLSGEKTAEYGAFSLF